MRRILMIKTWVAFALTFWLTHTALAENGEKYDLTLALVIQNSQSIPLLYDGKSLPSSWSAATRDVATDGLAEILKDRLQGAAWNIFRSIKIVKPHEHLGELDVFPVNFKITKVNVGCNYIGNRRSGCITEVNFDLIVNGTNEFTTSYKQSFSGASKWGFGDENFDTGLAPSAKAAMALATEGMSKTFGEDAGFLALVKESSSKSDADTDLADLQPLLATYRVTESEAVIRRKPNTKAGVVRKSKLGGILQIIGQLPSGWLQVAKEGEPIGWVHSDSVALFFSQQTATAAAPQPAPVASPAPTHAAAANDIASTFPTKPVAVSFKPAKPNPDDIAVIIGNANYKATAKDIPDVVPAYADAEGMKRYATQALGIKDENVILIKDAKLADLIATFGNDNNPKGKLYNWVKPQASNVFIFYSGHGAPNGDGTSSYLVPVDATASLIDLSGYSLKTLYGNLGKLPAKSVTVVLEACFSGAAQSGMLVKNASPIYQKAMQELVPTNLTVISAGTGNQIASWEEDQSHGLFTKHYLLGMSGAADKKPYGNGDGKVSTEELTAYLKGTMSYMAQRYYGREQTAQIIASGKQ